MTAFAFIGVAVTSATIVIFGEAIWDPVVLVGRIGGAAVIIFSALVVLAAQLTTNMAANVVSPSNDFSNLAPRVISFRMGGIITALIGIVSFPWKLYEDVGAYIFTWLVGYGSLLAAFAAVMVIDYWILRRTRLNVDDLYRPYSRYWFTGGFNVRALASVAIGVIPVLPGFLHAATTKGGVVADPNFLDQLYRYGIFMTFGLAGAAYLLLNLAAAGARQPAAATAE
jgi:NCS1 family nucleobase:cation symporter-1